jgi:CubicO group peptidase (beta-lactamase class C family)
MERAKLDELKDALAARRTTAFLVARHNEIVYEWYAPGHGPWRREGTASLAKSLVGGMSLLVALSDGRVGLDDPAWKYVPLWKGDPDKSKITIRHLATHSSGIGHGRDRDSSGWKEAFWKRKPNLFSAVLGEAPATHTPGARYLYSGPAFAVLTYAITHWGCRGAHG